MTFDYPAWHEIPDEIKILRGQFTKTFDYPAWHEIPGDIERSVYQRIN